MQTRSIAPEHALVAEVAPSLMDPCIDAYRGSMSMDAADADARREDLLSTLEVIEGQPLAERAAAYGALHDELARRLESGPRDAHA